MSGIAVAPIPDMPDHILVTLIDDGGTQFTVAVPKDDFDDAYRRVRQMIIGRPFHPDEAAKHA